MSLTLLDCDAYTTKFTAYPADLVALAREHGFTLPNIDTLRGQAIALMAQPEVRGQKYVDRDQSKKFFRNIGMETSDAIQPFNKATGLKRIPMKGKYCLVYPFEPDTVDLDKRKGVSISGDRDAHINAVKARVQRDIIDVPNERWQIGHLDPTISDASEKNLAWQPPIQAKFRDRFKFDRDFRKMWPTGAELIRVPDKFYTEAEQRAIYDSLKAKFEAK